MIRPSAIAILSLAAHPAAGDFSLRFPVDCTVGTNCYIQHLVDLDPGATVQDFRCGDLSYDGHKGTDIALPSLAAQAAGVAVIAAAAGTVIGVRNDMEDALQFGPAAPDIVNRECGNGVVIKHTQGYETQYCHLAKGSVTVNSGQQVQAGTPLGQIGLSGKTQFPHLHFSVRHNGAVVDPFDTVDARQCDDPLDPLWARVPETPAGGLISIGMHDGVPHYQEVKAGTADTVLTSSGPAMVGWAFVYMARKGDILTTQITGPDRVYVSHSELIKRDQAQLYRASGRRTPADGWPAGDYLLEVELVRGDTVLDREIHTFHID